MSRYLVRIVERRTFWVRVSSSVVGVELLVEQREFADAGDRGQALVDPRDRLGDQGRRPRACRERSLKVVNGSRLVSAQFPTLPMSIWISATT